jgi:hypothetical protein
LLQKAGGHFSDLLKRRAALPVSSLVEDHFPAGSGLSASISPIAFYFCTKKTTNSICVVDFLRIKTAHSKKNQQALSISIFSVVFFDFYVDSCASEILPRELLFLVRKIKNVISLAREQTRRRAAPPQAACSNRRGTAVGTIAYSTKLKFSVFCCHCIFLLFTTKH